MTKKKGLLLGGGVAVLAGLVALTAVLTGGTEAKNPPVDTPVSEPNLAVAPVADDAQTEKTEPAASEPVFNPEQDKQVEVDIAEPETDTTEPAPPAVKDESQLTNPDTPPSYEQEDTTVTPGSDTPKNGDKKDGKIYIEGFGWIEDEGGQAQGEAVDSDGDIDKQVGYMG